MFNIFVLVYIETYENYLRQINKNYTVMMFLSAVDDTLVASLPNSIISNATELEKSDHMMMGKDHTSLDKLVK